MSNLVIIGKFAVTVSIAVAIVVLAVNDPNSAVKLIADIVSNDKEPKDE